MIRDSAASEAALSLAERALGLVSRDVGRLRRAIEHLEASIAHARAAGDPALEADTRSSLIFAWLKAGEPRRALREADIAAALPGVDKARLMANRALVLQRLGRDAEALDDYGRALRAARRADDATAEARILSNRGVLEAYRGELASAERDLERAHELHLATGAAVSAAEVLHNLGFLKARRGDMPGALACYDEAGRAFSELGLQRSEALVDRCEALMVVRLLPEARAMAEAAVAGCEEAGRSADAAEARVMLARACLLGGDVGAAAVAATAARVEFVRERRQSWATLARFVELQVAAAAGSTPRRIEREAMRIAPLLAEAGWAEPALESLVLAATSALESGRVDAARAALGAAPAARRRAPAALRVRAWHAEAVLRLAGGDRKGALSALRSGLRVADEYRATLGATELRVRSGAIAGDLAELGTSLAIESGHASEVLSWIERWRARLLEPPASRPPSDPAAERLLAQLRETVARIGAANLAGDDTSQLVRRQYTLEMEIRRLSHTATRERTGRAAPERDVATPRELQEVLGPERCLVELVAERGRLVAIVVSGQAGRRARLVDLGPSAEVESERAAMLFALGRLSRRRGGVDSLTVAAASLERASQRLDQMLMAPLARYLGDRELVLVPTGELHAMAWSLLPSLRSRPLTIVPSATLWLEQERAARRDARSAAPTTALVAGPGVPGSALEIKRLRDDCYPGATVLDGAEASCSRVGELLECAKVAHVVAHGEFRADNPLFSSLVLADGPLTVYDLEALRTAPSCLVLSACDAGLTTTPHGGHPMGPMAALLEIGTRSLVASVAPVPDDGAADFMLAFHGRMVAGESPGRALAGAQGATIGQGLAADGIADGDPGAVAALAAAGYVCYGAG